MTTRGPYTYKYHEDPMEGLDSPSTSSPIDLVPSKNPLPLSATQEGQVRDIYYARVRAHCAKEIKEFADCARNRTITATWKCRNQRLNMNTCMVKHATQEELDKARQEWFRIRLEKRRIAEEASRKKVEVVPNSSSEG